MKEFKAYHKNSDTLKYERVEYLDGYNYERTYNEQGQQLTFKNSSGYYAIKGKRVTKEEFEAFVNNDIIEVNGVKYKKI